MTKDGYRVDVPIHTKQNQYIFRVLTKLETSIEKRHIFDLKDSVKKFLMLTPAPPKDAIVKLPFDNVFLAVQFTKEQLKHIGVKTDSDRVFGIMVHKATISDFEIDGEEYMSEVKKLKKKGMELPDVLNSGDTTLIKELGKIASRTDLKEDVLYENGLAITVSHKHRGDYYYSFLYEEDEFPQINCHLDRETGLVHWSGDRVINRKLRKFLIGFVKSFLLFVTQKEVKYVKVTRSKKNIERRKRQGKPIYPSSYRIYITGKFKQYVDYIKNNPDPDFRYSHKFPVMGHWRTLKSDFYKEKQGQTIWIDSYTKGEGMLIKKDYEVDKESDEDERVAKNYLGY
jgi:hypothetical protein